MGWLAGYASFGLALLATHHQLRKLVVMIGDIHPLQLVSKKYIKGHLFSSRQSLRQEDTSKVCD